jgi:23S rRNA pseudouridine1911/1915/1917 synthase
MGSAAKVFAFAVAPEDEGRRLDQVLAARVPDLSRRLARVLLDMGGVFVDDTRAKMAGRPVKAGQRIVAHLGGALARATKQVGTAARARDEATLPAYDIVFEDDDLVVVDKPAGLLTAPTPESDRNNLAGLLKRRPGAGPVFVVHRIDLETSGLLVFARSPGANRVLGETFRRHDLLREYLVVVAGAVAPSLVTIDRPVGGRRAVTHLAVEERFGTAATLVRARLETGRTHQIRLHLRAEGHPVLGDRKYGTPTDRDPPRIALHATRLAFAHPASGAPLAFERPWPPDLTPWLEKLRAAAPPAG